MIFRSSIKDLGSPWVVSDLVRSLVSLGSGRKDVTTSEDAGERKAAGPLLDGSFMIHMVQRASLRLQT